MIEDAHGGAQRGEIEKSRLEAIVEIGCVIRNLIDEIDQLGFERRALVQEIFREIGKFSFRIVARVFDDAFANFKGEIQAGEIEIIVLELLDDPQGMEIVVEAAAAIFAHARIELMLAGVAEWRVPDIMRERESLREVRIQMQSARDRAGDLRDFERVSEAVAEMIGKAGGENLSLGFETPESAGVNHAIAIASVVAAVGMPRLGVSPPARPARVHGIGCKHRYQHSSLFRGL